MMEEFELSENKKKIIFKDNDSYIKSQDNIFREDDSPWRKAHKKRNEEVINILLKYGNIESICDVGCRVGISLEILKDKNIEALGVELSPRNVEQAKSLGRNVILGDAHELSNVVNEKFDAVLSVHSLEHCHTPEKVISECYKILKDNGKIAIRVPVQKDLAEQRYKDGDYGKLPQHFSVHSLYSLTKLLISQKFKILYSSEIEKEVTIVGKK